MDEATVRLTPCVRAQLDAMRQRDRLRELRDRTPTDRGDALLMGLLEPVVRSHRERHDELLRRADELGLRVAFDPPEFGPVERDGDTWRTWVTQSARMVRPDDEGATR